MRQARAQPEEVTHRKESRRSSTLARRRVAFLGAGYIADWHAKAIASVAGAELVAVCDQVLPRARSFAEKFGVAGVHGSLDAMLAAEKLDAVHVLLPPDLHFQAAEAILSAGVHVFLEKPMCTRGDDCETLLRLAASAGLSVGVGHNFLFSEPYERLRRNVHDGVLGNIDHVVITWHHELPQVRRGPFDSWMLRDPGNVMLEIGSHSVAHMLDLVGTPDAVRVRAGNPFSLPTGQAFPQRWLVHADVGRTAVELRFSFAPGFGERTIHLRGLLASATANLDLNTYTLRRHRPLDEDLDRFAMVRGEARDLRRQAWSTLRDYALSKLHLRPQGSPYGRSVFGAMDAFHAGLAGSLDPRVSGEIGANVVRICERIAASAGLTRAAPRRERPSIEETPGPAPRILVLGATGFIGQELVRQLVGLGHLVRVLARDPSKLPGDQRGPLVQCVRGDLTSDADLRQAMVGIDCVYHLARANVKTWADYERYEVGVTRKIAEHAAAAGVKRFIYTGTMDSYYAGAHAGTITEDTPLDPLIERRNPYARAKAASEGVLMQMHRERALPVVVFRPGIVIGRGASPLHWGVGMWWYGSICQTWGRGLNKLPLVLVEDVARALVAALDAPAIEGESFNLVADPCLSAQEYLDELDRCGMRIQRYRTPIVNFYLWDMFKWAVKVLVRHPERRRPSYRDWETRTQLATFDCSRAKARLGWRPVGDRARLVELGIRVPLMDLVGEGEGEATA